MIEDPFVDKCPACGADNLPSEFVGYRGLPRGVWRRCPFCLTYFACEAYILAAERKLSHLNWNRREQALFLQEYKRRLFHSVIQLILMHRPPPGRLCDIGCSYGGFLAEARRAGYDVCGIDIVQEAVEYTQTLGIPSQQCHSIADLDAADESLDVVTVLDCNYYWPDQPLEIARIRSKLVHGGCLVMRVVDKSWMFRMGELIGRLCKDPGEALMRSAVIDHRFSMPISSLLRLLSDSGFRVEYASPRGACHSHQSRSSVKLSFAVGTVLWSLTGKLLAPGALVLAKKELDS